jgi:oligo-1,6-glucosidase
LVYGEYELFLDEHPEIYCFARTLDDDRLIVILNCKPMQPVLALPTAIELAGKDLMISNYPVDLADDLRMRVLRPYEARVYQLLEPVEL